MRSLTGIVLSALVLTACEKTWHTRPQVVFQKNNVLLPQIQFATTDSRELFIEFWPVNRPSKRQKSISNFGTRHQITLFNVKPSTEYAYRIYSDKNSSKEFRFKTDSVPANVLGIRKDKIDTTLFTGYILLRRFFKQGADVLIDKEGDIVWYHQYDTAVRRAFSWTPNNTILSIYDSARIVETDLLGNRLLDLDLEKLGLPYKVHHEVFYDRAGDIVTITHDSARFDLRKFGGTANQYLTADGILVLSKEGEVRWKWNLLDAENPAQFKGKINLRENWGHANSITLDSQGNYLISFRDFNQVWKIDAKDGKVIWKFGQNGTIKPDHPSSYFIRQHSIHFNSRGELMMFDNGDLNIRPNSRIVSFMLDEEARTAKTAIQIQLPRALSSYRMCSAEMIEPGKHLVCTTRKDAIITVVGDAGEILWRVTADNASYRAYFLKNPFSKFVQ
jgi:outer membrane protein assembly factor BamB